MRRRIVSSQDFSPAPYPLYADSGNGQEFAIPATRTRERYWLYSLLFAAHAADHDRGWRRHADRFRPQSAVRCGARLFDVRAGSGAIRRACFEGLPFSLTLLTILLAHEFGHYLAAMYHRVDASLPYFMPSPFLGTFGAFIRVRSPIYSKRVLFDIGVAGPLAGFVFLLPALSVGLAFSKVIPEYRPPGDDAVRRAGSRMAHGTADFPRRAARPIFICTPWRGPPGWGCSPRRSICFPSANWMAATFSIPSSRAAIARFPQCSCVAAAAAWAGSGWAGCSGAWSCLWLGRRHPPIFDDPELTAGRRKLGWLALTVFLLCFTWAPIAAGGL